MTGPVGLAHDGAVRFLLALTLGCFVLGCSQDYSKTPSGDECSLTSDCAAPLVCSYARCRTQCFETRDCPLGTGCIQDNEGFGVCLIVDEVDCSRDSDCLAGLVCRFGECVNECADTQADCTPGTVCMEGSCVDTARLNRCVYPDECPFDENLDRQLVCIRGGCRLGCVSDRDCAEFGGTFCDLTTNLCRH